MTLFVRIEFDDDNWAELTTGDEISMMDVIHSMEQTNSTVTIAGKGIKYVIDMSMVRSWHPVRKDEEEP